MIFENFGVQSMTGGVLSVSEYPVTKWLYLTLNGTLIYMGNKAKDVPGTQKPYQNNGFLSNAYGQITFVLPKDWKIELNAMYQGPVPYGYFHIDPMFLPMAALRNISGKIRLP